MWAGPSGQRWLSSAIRFEKTLKPIGDVLIERAKLAPGENVLDVGCGAGSMSLQMSDSVSPNGSVTGLDISPDLIKEATRRLTAARPKVAVRFVQADAARADLPTGAADIMVSRFGTMFFTDPYAAFTHLHHLIRKNGRLVLAVWAPMKENPWMLEMRNVMAAHFDLPKLPPHTPGPFAFEEPDYLRDILTKSGFTHIDIAPWQTHMYVGGPGSDPESATDFLFQAMSIAQRAVDATPEVQKLLRQELCDKLKPFMTPEGVRMPASVFYATARA